MEKSASRVAFAEPRQGLGQGMERQRSASGSVRSEASGGGPRTGTARTTVAARFDRTPEAVRNRKEDELREERRDELEHV